MATTSIINCSQLEDTRRIDAEYYQPEYLRLERRVKQYKQCTPWKSLRGRFITGPFGSQFKVENYITHSPFRYVRGRDVKPFFLLDDDNVYIPKKDFERLAKYALKEGDILVSVVGTLGNAAIIDEDVLPAIFSCKSTVYRCAEVNPFYLVTCLNCRFGRELLARKVRGAVQTGLNIGDLKGLAIFLPNDKAQGDVGSIIAEAKKHHDTAKRVHLQAKQLLLDEMGVRDFPTQYERAFVKNLSSSLGARRLDAEYFQPIYQTLMNQLDRHSEIVPLSNLLINFQKGVEVGSDNYLEEGECFMRVSNMSTGGFVDRDQKYISDELYKRLRDDFRPQIGDLLLTKDATPGIAYVVKECVEGIIAGGIVRLGINQKRVNNEYLALCINSFVGQLQIERDGGGSVIKHWRPDQIRNLQIPLVSPKIQQRIAALALESHQAEMKATELLDKAKKKVEQMIEGG